MSQENIGPSKKTRRTVRSQRYRPALVITKADEPNTQRLEHTTDTLVADTSIAEETIEATKEQPTSTRKFPSFFSTIGKSEQDPATKEADVAQARLARATRKKTAQSGPTPAIETSTKNTAKPAPPSSAKARPASAFKTRYIIGMALYLLSAQFIGVYESMFMSNLHLDHEITHFNLFGGNVVILPSTLLYLATLVLILVILASLDLIPRSFSAMSGAPANKAGKVPSKANQETVKPALPLTKQGVQGADDKLYQAYRANQRREKKR